MIICVVGPTGVGKTKLSVELAKKYNAIIINADSTQVYKGMNIGTAKIKEKEKEDIPHYLFDIVDVNVNYTVYDYQKDARKIIEDNKGKNIIFVGGSGLYLKAVLFNYVFNDEEQLINNYEDLTNEDIYTLALLKDHNLNIHINDRKKLIRFLNKKQTKNEECYQIYDAIIIGLTTDRETLYNRIDNRTLEQFDEGLINEVRYFYDNNINSKSIKTAIGYKELYRYFNDELTLEEVKALIQKNCRQYAKRQYTWFNNQMSVTWFNVDFNNFDNTIMEVINFIDNCQSNEKE